MSESDHPCQIRRRRSSGNPNLPLNLEVGYKVNESGGPSQGTPSPSCVQYIPDTRNPTSSAALQEFRKKQQSFDIQIEECDEEEIMLESEDEGEAEAMVVADRPITPTPIQDFSASVVYTEGPQTGDFLKVTGMQTDCVTDVSDAESDGDE